MRVVLFRWFYLLLFLISGNIRRERENAEMLLLLLLETEHLLPLLLLLETKTILMGYSITEFERIQMNKIQEVNIGF